MKVLEQIEVGGKYFAITESATPKGGRQWGNPVRLRLVEVAKERFEKGLNNVQLPRNKDVNILMEYEVDARNQGSRSGHFKRFKKLKGELKEIPAVKAYEKKQELEKSTIQIPPSFKDCVGQAKQEAQGLVEAQRSQARRL